MGQHADEIGLRREFGLVELALDRLDRDDAQRGPPRQPHFGHRQQRRGRHAADHRRVLPRSPGRSAAMSAAKLSP